MKKGGGMWTVHGGSLWKDKKGKPSSTRNNADAMP